jgi:hypothetical protein
MNPATTKCQKCGGEMKEGFVPDRSYGKGFAATWVDGKPETNWIGGVKLREQEMRPVRTFCCQSCGYLESYANPP